MKRVIYVFIFLFSLILLSSCSCNKYKVDKQEDIDSSKTQLYVQNFKGGFGSDWIYEAKSRFENMYKDKEFTKGKKGVQVVISPAKVDGISLRTSNTGKNEVFFGESIYYYDFLKDDYFLDITDAITNPLTEFNETESIEDKMTEEQKNYYKANGKYYGIPHYAGYNGFIYDVDLFKDNLLYFKDSEDSTFIVDEQDKLSTGPDGLYNTADDGLPRTYDEFFILCDYMVDLGIIPFVWAGEYYNTYIEGVMNALCVDFEGLDQTMLNYSFRGRATNIINPVKKDKTYSYMFENGVDITPKNGYLLWASEGKYKSLDFFERIVKNSDYYTNLCFSPSLLYRDAQKDFLESTPKGKSIAMILEGCWWENEAKDDFKAIADYYGSQYSRENRNFSMLPLPKATKDQIGNKSTIVDTHYSLGFIKKDIAKDKIELAKTFLRFCCTDVSLGEFSVSTNTVKALNYDLTNEQYNKLTTFGKSVYNLHKNSDIVYPYSKEEIYLDNQSILALHNSYGSKIDTKEENHPITYFRSGKSNNAVSYFNGLIEYNKNRWDRVFGDYE